MRRASGTSFRGPFSLRGVLRLVAPERFLRISAAFECRVISGRAATRYAANSAVTLLSKTRETRCPSSRDPSEFGPIGSTARIGAGALAGLRSRGAKRYKEAIIRVLVAEVVTCDRGAYFCNCRGAVKVARELDPAITTRFRGRTDSLDDVTRNFDRGGDQPRESGLVDA